MTRGMGGVDHYRRRTTGEVRPERVGNTRFGSIPALSWLEPRPTAVRTIENRAELKVGRPESTISASKTGHLGYVG